MRIWPDRVLMAAEVCHTIKRDAEGDVVRVREVFVALGLSVNHDLLLEEIVIDRGIEYVPDNIVATAGAGVGVSILQLFCDGLVPKHRPELVLHGQVLEMFDRDPGAFVPGFLAVWADVHVSIGSGEAAATTGTAVNPSRSQP